MITIYTDGSCLNNLEVENQGGWAYYILYPNNGEIEFKSGGKINTTNQRMELTACIKAIERVSFSSEDVVLYTDSAYVVNCIKDRWYTKWYQNGWKNAKGEPVKNQDLWKELLEIMGMKFIDFKHIKGHNGNKYNDTVDRLAKAAAEAAIEVDTYNGTNGGE